MLPRRMILGAFLALPACTARYRYSDLDGKGGSKLDRSRLVYVVTPADSGYAGRQANGSGNTVASAVAEAFSKQAVSVRISEGPLSQDAALAAARTARAGYVVMPAISLWEQRATEWSGRPSRIALRLTVLDASNGEQVSVKAIEARSRVVSLTSTSPESLLRSPVTRAIRELYGAPAET